MVRALLAPGTVVERCDVESLTSSSWDEESNRNGEVVGVYVRADVGRNELYGWVMQAHRDETGACVAHLKSSASTWKRSSPPTATPSPRPS
jgi:hypothetical protein